MIFELEGALVGVDRDSGLWYPCDGLGETRVGTIEEHAMEPEGISDGAVTLELLLDSLMPSLDARM
jgi:hypothetical protein